MPCKQPCLHAVEETPAPRDLGGLVEDSLDCSAVLRGLHGLADIRANTTDMVTSDIWRFVAAAKTDGKRWHRTRPREVQSAAEETRQLRENILFLRLAYTNVHPGLPGRKQAQTKDTRIAYVAPQILVEEAAEIKNLEDTVIYPSIHLSVYLSIAIYLSVYLSRNTQMYIECQPVLSSIGGAPSPLH